MPRGLISFALLFVPFGLAAGAVATPADLVILHARVYTADGDRSIASALAVRDGNIAYVGDDDGARAWIGPRTRVRDVGGRLVLPGLIDSHIHPTDIVRPAGCDLDSRQVSFAELASFIRACIRREHTPPGHWVSVRQWNYGNGNAPDARHPTLRATLDSASATHPIHLLGNDGHHGAFNSMALAGARNERGEVVGLSAATLAGDFRRFSAMVGLDAAGEPDGAVNETLQYAIDGPNEYAEEHEDFEALMRDPAQVMRLLNRDGITGFLDAALSRERVRFYDVLTERGALTARATLAQFYEPERFRDAAGHVDFERMVALASATRAHFAANSLVRADVVKLFADGGIDGNPSADPPTLPNGAVLRPYLQPRIHADAHGARVLDGYVDTESKTCTQVRADPAAYASAAAVAEFRAREGFHPAQCAISSGSLYQPEQTIAEFVRQFHAAGFALHIHVIGDRAARVAIDAIEAARAGGGGPDPGRDGLAHLELADPADVARIGRDRLHVAFTYSWSYVDPEYDATVIPFLERVDGLDAAALHAPGSYFDGRAYPTRSVRDAGGILVGGSDAPVDSRDPRPFVNIARAVTRHLPGHVALNPAEAITIRDALDSYTINGARFLGYGDRAGSLEAGKSADFIVVDRDVLALAAAGHADEIEGARVLETWFQGQRVWRLPNSPRPHH